MGMILERLRQEATQSPRNKPMLNQHLQSPILPPPKPNQNKRPMILERLRQEAIQRPEHRQGTPHNKLGTPQIKLGTPQIKLGTPHNIKLSHRQEATTQAMTRVAVAALFCRRSGSCVVRST